MGMKVVGIDLGASFLAVSYKDLNREKRRTIYDTVKSFFDLHGIESKLSLIKRPYAAPLLAFTFPTQDPAFIRELLADECDGPLPADPNKHPICPCLRNSLTVFENEQEDGTPGQSRLVFNASADLLRTLVRPLKTNNSTASSVTPLPLTLT